MNQEPVNPSDNTIPGAPLFSLGVVGPTASGKSDLAVFLAKSLNGEVVNVDSVQVYKDCNIGSAKLSKEEQQGIPHHCLDIFSPDKQANVAQFKDAALSAISDITSRGKLPILAGGSGMYLTVLLHGLAAVPDTPSEVREKFQSLSNEEMYSELKRIDPVTAERLHVNDRQRVSRALEVYEVSKTLPSTLFNQHRFETAPVTSLLIVLCHPREELYERINRRAEKMIQSGLLDETASLIKQYGESPVLSTIGYLQAKQYIEGKLPKEKVVEEIALHTRRFSKRQMTYLRNEPKKRGWNTFPTEEQGVAIEPVELEKGSKQLRKKGQMKTFSVLQCSNEELLSRIKNRVAQGIRTTEVWYVSIQSDN